MCPDNHLIDCRNQELGQIWECSQCSASSLGTDPFPKQCNQLAYCSQCDYTLCSNCAFLLTSRNKSYVDIYGVHYLSTRLSKPFKKIVTFLFLQSQKNLTCQKCPSKHQILPVFKNPTQNISYSCSKCSKRFCFVDQQGMGSCPKCSLFVCPGCIFTKPEYDSLDPTTDEKVSTQLKETEYVQHLAGVFSAQGTTCFKCQQPYKKAYETKNDDGAICALCSNPLSKSALHVCCPDCKVQVCLACIESGDSLQKLNSSKREQLLLSKAVSSGKLLMSIKSQSSDPGDSTPFRCRQKGHVVKVSYGPMSAAEHLGTYDCLECKGQFYINSLHYTCNCGIFSCGECVTQVFFYLDVNFKCNKLHPLVEITAYDLLVNNQSHYKPNKNNKSVTPYKPLNFFCSVCKGLSCVDQSTLGGSPAWRCETCPSYMVCRECACHMHSQPDPWGKPQQSKPLKQNEQKTTLRSLCDKGHQMKKIRLDQKASVSISYCRMCEELVKDSVVHFCKYCQSMVCHRCMM